MRKAHTVLNSAHICIYTDKKNKAVIVKSSASLSFLCDYKSILSSEYSRVVVHVYSGETLL